MLNSLVNSKFDLNDVTSMIRGHKKFLDRNTGLTNNARTDHWVFNPQHVLSNNRHFTNQSMQEGQPNGDATTEGQSLLILGYLYSYLATGIKEYLDDAIKYFDAYVNYFYVDKWDEDGGSTGHNPIPDIPQAWICNWIINGKEEVDSDYPLDPTKPVSIPTHGGFKGIEFDFPANLQIQIPQGAPYFGEYLDKCPFAFDGFLGWDSLVATVYGSKKDKLGNDIIDWSADSTKRGKQYDVDWIIDLYGHKISWPDGYYYDKNPDGSPKEVIYPDNMKGTVQLKSTYTAWREVGKDAKGLPIWESYDAPTPSGKHKLNFTSKVPASKGGHVLPRNKPWHNRPVNVPVGLDDQGKYTLLQQLGNSSDSEQWFADACYILYQITKDDKYNRAWQSVIFNTDSYSDIDAVDRFFRKSVVSTSPWTDGISYDYFYPENWTQKVDPDDDKTWIKRTVNDATINRDDQGYIRVQPGWGCTRYTMEQQAVWYKVNERSIISTEVGGQIIANPGGIQSNNLNVNVLVKIADSKSADERSYVSWGAYYPTDSTGNINVWDLELGSFVRITKPGSLEEYMTIGPNDITAFGGMPEPSSKAEYQVVDNRQANIPQCVFTEILDPSDTGDNDGFAIGIAWNDPEPSPGVDPRRLVKKMTYRLDAKEPIWMNFEDVNGWVWHYVIPPTGSSWSTISLIPEMAVRNAYQANHPMPAKHSATPGWDFVGGYDIDGTHVLEFVGNLPNKELPAENYYIAGTKASGGNQWRWKDVPGGVPTRPANTDVYQYTLSRGSSTHRSEAKFSVYCFDDIPPLYSSEGKPQYLMLYQLNVGIDTAYQPSGDYLVKVIDKPEIIWCDHAYCSVRQKEVFHFEERKGEPAKQLTYEFKIGDCYVKNYLKGNLTYTPGVIPFSNIYSDGGTETFDGWHGMPYPGYQHPFIWTEFQKDGFEERLNNMANFLYDSQQEYYRRYGQLGPGMSAYVWNRWDNYKYGPPDSWTEYHWKTDHAWSGYQPRAFASAARAAYELMLNNQPIPEKLTQYCVNWVKWLYKFISDSFSLVLKDDNGNPLRNPDGSLKRANRPISPTEWYFVKQAAEVANSPYYTADGISRPNPDDYTGHMNGLWLTGCCFVALCDKKNELPELAELIEWLVDEINYHYKITGIANRQGVAHAMDGSWTPSGDSAFQAGFGSDCPASFYGFWAGEILRGLGLYLLYKNLRPGEDMYALADVYQRS